MLFCKLVYDNHDNYAGERQQSVNVKTSIFQHVTGFILDKEGGAILVQCKLISVDIRKISDF